MPHRTTGQTTGGFAGTDEVDRKSRDCPDYCKTFTFRDANGSLKQFVFPKALDLDRPKRARTTFSNQQLELLESEFKINQYLVGKERTELASRLGLSETQVKVWFQNRRTKFKKDKDRQSQKTDSVAESLATKNVLMLLEYKTPTTMNQTYVAPTLRQGQSPTTTKDTHDQRVSSGGKLSPWDNSHGQVKGPIVGSLPCGHGITSNEAMSRRESQDSMMSHYNYRSSVQSYPYHHYHQPSSSLSPHVDLSLFHNSTFGCRASLAYQRDFESGFVPGKPSSRYGMESAPSEFPPRLPLYQRQLMNFSSQVPRY